MIKDANMNRLGNSKNYNQGEYKKVLCVCSAGLLRSPTAAFVLSQEPYNFNTRSIGLVDDYALIRLDPVLLRWADEIVCMTQDQKAELEHHLNDWYPKENKPVICLNIEDDFRYRDPELIELIKKNYPETK